MSKFVEWVKTAVAVLVHPVRTIDVVAHAWLRARGYETVEAEPLAEARKMIAGTFDYVDKSGHLNTVSGRRPRAIERLKGGLGMAYILTAPDAPSVRD